MTTTDSAALRERQESDPQAFQLGSAEPARILHSIENLIYSSRRSLFIATGLLLSLVKTGIWYMPNLDEWRATAVSPFKYPFKEPGTDYIFWNWLSPFLAWLLRLNGEHSFFYFHLGFSIAFTVTCITLFFARLDEKIARTAFVLFLALPASATAYFWVGMDSVTLLLLALLLAFPNRLAVALLLGIALGMQHFEQGVFAIGGVAASLLLSRAYKSDVGYSFSWAATSFFGVGLGKVALAQIFRHFHTYVNSGRLYYYHQFGHWMLVLFAYHFQYILWSVLGVGWIAVIKFAQLGKRAAPFLVCLVGLLFLLPFVFDETRVACIVTFPLVAIYLLLNRTFLESLHARSVTWIFALWVIVPWPWIQGTPKWSAFPYDVAFLLHKYLGWFDVPANSAVWPFR
jgi:hypothetical protein